MEKFSSFAQLYLRVAVAVSYLVFGFDRLGVFGKPGEKIFPGEIGIIF
ncbi:MAG TPA: hypothetical protein VJU78_11870 [Chitinophagaceae bacterium]|nr:hypothetical protein [Chitinophagaceae bacterium]